MKTLNISSQVLLIILMLLSVIQMFFYYSTIEHFAICWSLFLVSGTSFLILNKQSIK